ncbi:three-Cys-motif partner protein TcmP [Spirosoma jeollabukense]
MPNPDKVVWECAPHTIAKHKILEYYLGAWFPILARYNGKIIYVDGFSGPGEYIGGEKGSPLIALEVAAAQQKHLVHSQVGFEFIEQDEQRAKNLESAIATLDLPENFTIDVARANFQDVINSRLDSLDKSGTKNAPIFAFIDPFGFSGVPYSLLKRLLTYEKTEVFVYFARNSINRFVEVAKVEQHMKDLFGLEKIEVPAGVNRLDFLKGLYESQLKEIAKYVGSFSMINAKGVPIYDLFFASNNLTGYVKMKEAMWKVDETGGFKFDYRDDPSQAILFPVNPLDSLVKLIKEKGKGGKDLNIDRIERYVESNTIYLASHMKRALRQLEEMKVISVQKIKADGNPRRGKFFAPGTIIDFN